MTKEIVNRIISESNYILKTKETIREIALSYKVSKSTVHKDLHERLKEIDTSLYNDVNDILQYHASIRHIRGGESTKQKYLNLSN